MSEFSRDFFWGAATSAHQVEGANKNDWTAWEFSAAQKNAGRARDRKWPEYIMERFPNPTQEANYISGRAVEHALRFREDFDIMKSLGLNAYRFSIEWSRIEPEEGRFDHEAIEHYREVFRALRERDIEPFVTLWHWTVPQWFALKGGWEHPQAIDRFSRFCEKIAEEYKSSVRYWIVLNEPALWASEAYIYGTFPPARRSIFKMVKIYFILARVHRRVYTELKMINQNFYVGAVENMEWYAQSFLYPLMRLRNFYFLGRIRPYIDFIGVNYYRRVNAFGASSKEVSDVGWEIFPDGLFFILQETWRRFGKPVYVTENGIADSRDHFRERFLRQHVYEIEHALRDGIDVRGYFHWSLLDNFEWASGFWPRYGLVDVDYKTMERRVRRSAGAYAEIISESRTQ